MANVVKKEGGQAQQTQPQGQQVQGTQVQRGELVRRDPFQMLMRDPFLWMTRDPFQLMRDMWADPFRLLREAWGGGPARELVWSPDFEIRENDDAFIFKADLPGIRNEDLEISLAGNQLQITGKREQERERGEGRYYTYERSYGSFSRSFSLPEVADLDSIRSDLKDGVLTLVVPKKAGAKPQRRKIQIGAGAKS